MLIVWGKKEVRWRTGFVGDFCPFCRNLARFRAADLGQVSHLYYIPLGRGVPFATELTCPTCRTVVLIPSGTAKPEPADDPDLPALAARTCASGVEALTRRMEQESRVVRGLGDAERGELLAEPFRALENTFQSKRFRSRDESLTAYLGVFAAALALFGALFICAWQAAVPKPPWALAASIATGCVPLALGTWAVFRAQTKWRRLARSRRVLGPLTRSLGPLQPSPAEIERSVATLRREGFQLARTIAPAEVVAALERAAADPRNLLSAR